MKSSHACRQIFFTEALRIERVSRVNATVFFLHGIIDEDASLETLKEGSERLTINLRHVTGINSSGVRTWVCFVRSLSGREIILEDCPPVIVSRMNMVPNFLGHARVRSLFTCYTCRKCNVTESVLLERHDIARMPRARTCRWCVEGVMDFDFHPRSLFQVIQIPGMGLVQGGERNDG